MPRVVHFELQATEPEKVAEFYKSIFGWKFNKWEGPMEYWLIETGPAEAPGINGGLLRRNGTMGTVNTIDVPSVDDYVAKVTSKGGQVVMPKMAVPGVGYLAYCQDPDGNVFGMMQMDPTAK